MYRERHIGRKTYTKGDTNGGRYMGEKDYTKLSTKSKDYIECSILIEYIEWKVYGIEYIDE